jgi:predicted DNA-binding transcriptional regulator YafY
VCWSSVWTLSAWCESRAAFRSFRVDRITALEVLDERFSDEPGKTLADLFRQIESKMSERDSSTDA